MTALEMIQAGLAASAVPATVVLMHDLLIVHAQTERSGRFRTEGSFYIEVGICLLILMAFVSSLFIV